MQFDIDIEKESFIQFFFIVNFIMHIILLLISIVFTQDITNDSLSVIIKERTSLILEEVYIDPLEDKRFGIELSPLYSMFVHDGLSGSFSNFNLSDVAEITFPFSYRAYRRSNDEGKMEDRYVTYLDAQYRFF